MKKTILTLLTACLISNFACKKTNDPAADGNCPAANSTEYVDALRVWQADITNKSKCEAVLAVAQKYFNCSLYTAAQKKQYQEMLDSKPCSSL